MKSRVQDPRGACVPIDKKTRTKKKKCNLMNKRKIEMYALPYIQKIFLFTL